MNTPIYIPMSVSVNTAAISMRVAVDAAVLPVSVGMVISASTSPNFEGPYEYTPSEETQTIPIYNMRATRDITINPIPSNWGRITWNGSTLTVS